MTQEDKELLLKDLCARLPYGVKCIETTPLEEFKDKNLWEIDRIRKNTFMFGMSNCYVCYGHFVDIHNIKPYLYPLSSMTDEQKKEYYSLVWFDGLSNGWNRDDAVILNEVEMLIDFYNKNHLDWRGFIEKGLAIDATGLNIY